LGSLTEDGSIQFLGRSDRQMKIRGKRIELGEIEFALGKITQIQDYAVVALVDLEPESAIVCCAFVASNDSKLNIARFREELASYIPNYMIPRKWMQFSRLPRTSNGKLDISAIRKSFVDGGSNSS
jgi:acyl-coenzyme A synthetase/AMP-(fatty) acid ligase